MDGMDAFARSDGWIQTYSGRSFSPLRPRPEDVCKEDPAHHLAMKCRYQGACLFHYSVAQHACLLSDLLGAAGGPLMAHAALHHDDAEYVLPDIPSPVKPLIVGWKEIEEANELAIVVHAFGVDPALLPLVKPWDTRIRGDERAAVLAPPLHAWKCDPQPLGVLIEPWSIERAEAEWLERHIRLATILGLPIL